MIKRTAKSTTINGKDLLVSLPPHEIRNIQYPLSIQYKKRLQKADKTIMNQARTDYIIQRQQAIKRGNSQNIPKLDPYVIKFDKSLSMDRAGR